MIIDENIAALKNVVVLFRVVRPLTEPSDEEKAVKWDKSEPPQIDKDKNK